MDYNDVTLIDRNTGYEGFFKVTGYKLRHLKFNGEQTQPLYRECFERGHAVGVLAYDPWKDVVILLEQFRIGAWVNNDNPWLLEVIAGIIEAGEQPQEVACREAIEEAGCELLALEPVCNYYSSPGGTSETLELYCGCINSEGAGGIYGLEAEGEDIRANVVAYRQAVEMLQLGRINNASTIILMQWLMLNRLSLRDKWINLLTDKTE